MPVALRITGDPELVVTASLRGGIFLTLQQVRFLITELKLGEPDSGSGKNGNILKADLVQHLIAKMFPDCSEKDTAFMVHSLLVRRPVKQDDPELLVKLTSLLDTSEAQHFSNMRKRALDELATKSMKENAAKKAKMPENESKKRNAEDQGDKGVDKKPRVAADGKDEKTIRRTNIKAPPELLKFFPAVCDRIYFKWQPKHSRAGVEFVHKERNLE